MTLNWTLIPIYSGIQVTVNPNLKLPTVALTLIKLVYYSVKMVKRSKLLKNIIHYSLKMMKSSNLCLHYRQPCPLTKKAISFERIKLTIWQSIQLKKSYQMKYFTCKSEICSKISTIFHNAQSWPTGRNWVSQNEVDFSWTFEKKIREKFQGERVEEFFLWRLQWFFIDREKVPTHLLILNEPSF